MGISSLQNPVLSKVRRAVESGRPLEDGTVAAEGPHLLREAVRSAWTIQRIFCTAQSMQSNAGLLQSIVLAAESKRIEVIEVAERAFRSLSDTEHSQGIVSLLMPRAYKWQDLALANSPLVILDGIQDPGNAGAIIRSAEAFGCSGVIFTQGCVRTSNGKLLRSSAGSIFRLPYLENCSRAEIVSQLGVRKQTAFFLSAAAERSLYNTDLDVSFALVVGNEGNGVSPELQQACQGLCIPTQNVESLNAAVACSITLFEAARQRTNGGLNEFV